jgi:quercetin dioxygenase-like cupin family protein
MPAALEKKTFIKEAFYQKKTMKNLTGASGIEKSRPHIMVELLKYMPHSTLMTTIIKKITGTVMVTSMDAGEELAQKASPFDIFIQIIDGAAQLVIEDKRYLLQLGEGIIIPANAAHCFTAKEPFKMISTTIKSGYED